MKTLMRIAVIGGLVSMLVGSAGAQRARVLPEGAYIKSAKIEMSYEDPTRYPTAMALLDSLFMNYGPHGEGLYLMCRMHVNVVKGTPDLQKRVEAGKLLMAYVDSLHAACASTTIKKKYLEDCGKNSAIIDSMKVLQWRTSYNDGVNQLNALDEIGKSLAAESDSTTIAFYQTKERATGDSCIWNMELAIALDPTDFRPYGGIASVYERRKEYAAANEWLQKAADKAADKGTIYVQMAYNAIRTDDYAGAIPFFRSHLEINPQDTNSMYNLAICFVRTKEFDSAIATYHRILTIDPNNTDALSGIGQYYSQRLVRNMNDSATVYRDKGDSAKAKMFEKARVAAFDSARIYLKRVFELKTDDAAVAKEYGLVEYLLNNFEGAIEPQKRAAELEPTTAMNWINLGDTYVTLKKFNEAIGAYEKAVEIETLNNSVWRQLAALYKQVGNSAKAAEAEKKSK